MAAALRGRPAAARASPPRAAAVRRAPAARASSPVPRPRAPRTPGGARRALGVVKWFSEEKAYGFIAAADDPNSTPPPNEDTGPGFDSQLPQDTIRRRGGGWYDRRPSDLFAHANQLSASSRSTALQPGTRVEFTPSERNGRAYARNIVVLDGADARGAFPPAQPGSTSGHNKRSSGPYRQQAEGLSEAQRGALREFGAGVSARYKATNAPRADDGEVLELPPAIQRCFFEHNLNEVLEAACDGGEVPVAALPALARGLRAAGKRPTSKMLTMLLKRCRSYPPRNQSGGAAVAVRLMADARAVGMRMNPILYTAAANALAAERVSPVAMWEQMVEADGVRPDGFACVAFAAAAIKAREFEWVAAAFYGEEQWATFGALPFGGAAALFAAHPVLGTVVVQALGRLRRGRDAIAAFEACAEAACDPPDAFAYTTLITALGRSEMAEEAIEQLMAMRAAGVRAKGPVAYNAAMDACARLAEGAPSSPEVREQALVLLERAATAMEDDGVRPNNITYNTAMHACVASGTPARVFALFERMREAAVPRDITTYLQVLQACRAERQLDYAIGLVENMEAEGIRPTHWVYDLLMRTCYPERADAVCEAYESMRDRDGELEERFRQIGTDGTPFGMNSATMAAAAYGDAGNWRGVLDVMRDVRRLGYEPDEYLCNAAILSFGKCRQVELALNVLHAMRKGDNADDDAPDASRVPAATVVSYTAAIAVCAKNERMGDALGLLDRMEAEGIEPNAKTYSTLVQQAAEEGDVVGALESLVRMRRAGVPMDEASRQQLLDVCNKTEALAPMLDSIGNLEVRNLL